MTVCVACLCNWAYGQNDIGRAAITASDRQITAGDIEYEPPQLKISVQGRRALILVAGDYPTHTEALTRVSRIILSSGEVRPEQIAETYAGCLRDVKFDNACAIYLAPLGLNSSIFSTGDVAESLLGTLANNVMNYKGKKTEAIVAASDNSGAHLYLIDEESVVSCHDDVGFVAIGSGASTPSLS